MLFIVVLGINYSQMQARVVLVNNIEMHSEDNSQSISQEQPDIIEKDRNDNNQSFDNHPKLLENGNIHPILGRSNRVIGGTIDGKFVEDITMAEYIGGGEEYSLYSMTDFLGRFVGYRNEVRFLNNDYYIEFETQKGAAFGVLGNWNALPRVPAIIDYKSVQYDSLIKELLLKNGLEGAQINIKKVLSVDIEGDGEEETFIVACNLTDKDYEEISNVTFKDEDTKYSIVLMLKKVDGYEKGIIISECYKEATEYDINYLADVDGDGQIELSVNASYMSREIMEAEGYSLSADKIYDIVDDKLIEVLSVDSSPK